MASVKLLQYEKALFKLLTFVKYLKSSNDCISMLLKNIRLNVVTFYASNLLNLQSLSISQFSIHISCIDLL